MQVWHTLPTLFADLFEDLPTGQRLLAAKFDVVIGAAQTNPESSRLEGAGLVGGVAGEVLEFFVFPEDKFGNPSEPEPHEFCVQLVNPAQQPTQVSKQSQQSSRAIITVVR